MEWILWVIVGFIALSNLLMIGEIGKEKKPTTPGVAVTSVLIWSLIIWAIVAIGIY